MMLLLLFVTLFVSSIHGRATLIGKEIAVSSSTAKDYLLPDNVLPVLYQIELEPNFETDTFNGSSNITLSVTTSGNIVTLHTMELDIDESGISLLDESGNTINSVLETSYSNDDRQFYTITFEEILEEGRTYTLWIESFTGVLNNNNNGFFLARHTNEDGVERKLAVTDFVATFARRAFPCFDEPALKAEFEVSVIRPAGYDSNSNMPKISTEELSNGRYRDIFARTPRMSTYIVVVVVSDFTYVASQNQRVFLKPELIADGQGDYALSIGKPLLDVIAEYVGVPYALPKMDQIGIPNEYFRWQAMENWGLVTYLEYVLTATPTQLTTEIIAHEFGHQWFGNLVTPAWWSYVWLKEGFATYFQYYAAAIVLNYDFASEIVTTTTQIALSLDSSADTRPMNQDAGSPADLIRLLDTIAYYKGASVIRMVEGILSTDVFRRGLNIYLNRMEYAAARPTDLYSSWQEALNAADFNPLPDGEDVESVMITWDSKAGYPLLTVTRNYTDGSVTFSQRRLLASNPNNDDETIWYIPVSYATQSNPDFSESTPRVWLTTRHVSLDLDDLQMDDWIIVNIQQSGYYRINYDDDNWYRIIDFLATENADQIHPINRAQMIDDAYILASYGVIDYDIPLRLTQNLVRETSYTPLQSFVNALRFLDSQLADTSIYEKFKAYVLDILKRAIESIEAKENEKNKVISESSRQNVLMWMCSYGHQVCQDDVIRKVREWQRSESYGISPYLQVPLMCNVLKMEGPIDWEIVFQEYMVERNPILRANLTSSLGCSENKTALDRYLNTMLSSGENITSSERLAALSTIYESSNYGKTYMSDYIRDNWSLLKERFSSSELSSLITGIASRLSTKQQLVVVSCAVAIVEYKKMLCEMEDLALQTDAESIFRKGIDNLKSNVAWTEKYLPSITAWLNKRY